jgi:hypothetical protein
VPSTPSTHPARAAKIKNSTGSAEPVLLGSCEEGCWQLRVGEGKDVVEAGARVMAEMKTTFRGGMVNRCQAAAMSRGASGDRSRDHVAAAERTSRHSTDT